MSNPLPKAPGVNPNASQIPNPVADLGSLAFIAQVLKQNVDSLTGMRGSLSDRAVTYNDLVNLGLVSATTLASSGAKAASFAGSSSIVESVTTAGAGISKSGEILTVQWNAGDVNSLGANLSLSGGVLDLVGGVTTVVAGAGLTGGGTGSVTLSAQWRAGEVTRLGGGLALSGTTLVARWRGPIINSLGLGLSDVGNAITANWQLGKVTALSGLILSSGVLTVAEFANAQTGTTYTVQTTDVGKLVTFSNASPVAVTLPHATVAGFTAGFFFDAANLGAGTVTITPTISAIDGAASITLTTNQGIRIASDGANYFTVRGKAPTGTVTSIATGTGLTGGPITTTGTISLAAIANHDLLANTSGGSAAPIATTLTALIDDAIGSTQGDVLYRNGTVWTVLAPGSSGNVLTSGGAGANVSWGAAVGWTTTAVTGLGDGVAVSSGNLQVDHQLTQTVAGATATVTPTSGTSSGLVTLQASTTLTIANGSYNGQHFRLELLQDGTGTRTVAFDSSVKFGTDITSFTATTTPSKRDLVQLVWNGTAWLFLAAAHGF